MILQPLDQLTKIIKDALNGTAKVRKSFQTFFITTSILYLRMAKRINFTQMALYSDSCESRFRQNFQKEFDWVEYNRAFLTDKVGHRLANAIDPCYVSKAGKHTPGIGYFWSGSASATKWGLEILGIAAVDADDRDAVHLKAVQTVDIVSKGRPPKYLAGMDDPNSLLAWYLKAIASEKESLAFAFNMSLSSINVARAFARSSGMHLSVSNVKTLIHNADMIQRFIRMSGRLPHRLLNTNDFKELLYYGVSDAA